MARKVGLSIVEGIAGGKFPFRQPAKRNIGLLMERERGVPLLPYKVTSREDDLKYFGSAINNAYGQQVVKLLFDNADPAPVTLYGVRVVGSTSVTATTGVVAIGTVNVTVKAGYHGKDDPGTWGNNIKAILYSYNFKSRNNFLLEVYYKGDLVETFEGATCAAIQLDVNKRSGYITITFSAEIPTLTVSANLTGTIDTQLNSLVVTGTGTAFLTECPAGTVLYNSAGDTVLGTVQSVQSDTSLTLTGYPSVAVDDATFKKRVDTATILQCAGGTYVAPTEADFYGISDPVNPKGLAAFDGIDVQIVAVTENHTLTMAEKGKEYAESRKDCIFVAQLPLNANEGLIEAYANSLQTPTRSFICAYADWVSVLDDTGSDITVPGLGVILGAGFLRAPYLQGDYIHIPPAGSDSAYVNVKSKVAGKFSPTQVDKYVKDYTLNASIESDAYGIFLISSRTYSTNPLFHSIHITMQTNYYVRALYANLGFLVQRPNTPELKKEAIVYITRFFQEEYNKGALERSIPFKDAFKCICDLSNNPLSQDRKLLNITIEYIPTDATESVVISLNRGDAFLNVNVL